MADLLIEDVDEDVIETFKIRARLNGRTLEEEIRHLLNSHRSYTPEERVARSRAVRSQVKGVVPSLTLDEIREGLE